MKKMKFNSTLNHKKSSYSPCEISVEKVVELGKNYFESLIKNGYDKNEGCFTVNDNKAEIVTLIFREFLNGKGINEICNILNNSNLLRHNRQWCRNSVKYILTNEKYIGDCL